jgi:hypothetical protein
VASSASRHDGCAMTPIDELATILKPAGAGLYLVSTGKAEQ